MMSPRRNASAEMRPARVRSPSQARPYMRPRPRDDEAEVGVVGGDAVELGAQQRRLGGDAVGEGGVGPVGLEGDARRDEGEVVAAERAGVLARLPDVDLGPQQHERHRQAGARDRLRHGDDVGHDARRPRRRRRRRCGRRPPGCRRGSAGCRAPAVSSRRRCSHGALATLMPPSPCTASTMTAAGRSRPDAGVVEHLLEQVERVDVGAEVAVVGQARDVVEGDARGIRGTWLLPVAASAPS